MSFSIAVLIGSRAFGIGRESHKFFISVERMNEKGVGLQISLGSLYTQFTIAKEG